MECWRGKEGGGWGRGRDGEGRGSRAEKDCGTLPQHWMDDLSLTGLGNTVKEKEPAAY